jgi:hypothetical protein
LDTAGNPSVFYSGIQFGEDHPHKSYSYSTANGVRGGNGGIKTDDAGFARASGQKFDGIHCLRNENSTRREPCGPGIERCSADWPSGYTPKYHVMDPSCLMNGKGARASIGLLPCGRDSRYGPFWRLSCCSNVCCYLQIRTGLFTTQSTVLTIY